MGVTLWTSKIYGFQGGFHFQAPNAVRRNPLERKKSSPLNQFLSTSLISIPQQSNYHHYYMFVLTPCPQVPVHRGREAPDAMNLHHADTSLLNLLGRSGRLLYAVRASAMHGFLITLDFYMHVI